MTDDGPRTFGLMLRRPGDIANQGAEWGAPDEYEGIYLAPDFTGRHQKYDTNAGADPRWGEEEKQHWALSLPHNCDEWSIGYGTREEVLADARRFRAELDAAIAAMEACA